jgi:hypothetical protein
MRLGPAQFAAREHGPGRRHAGGTIPGRSISSMPMLTVTVVTLLKERGG